MDEFWAAITFVFVGVALLCWWLSGFSIRNRKTYEMYCKAMAEEEAIRARYEAHSQRNEELFEESNRLRAEEIALLRELIAELRQASRPVGPPGPDSN
jgi:hypothetical protein